MPSVLGNTPLGTSIALESDLEQHVVAVGKPFDAEVEYIEFGDSPGDVAFQTRIIKNSLLNIRLEGCVTQAVAGADEIVVGSWGGDNCPVYFDILSATTCIFYFGASNAYKNLNVTFTPGEWFVAEMAGNKVSCGSSSSTISRGIYTGNELVGIGGKRRTRIRRVTISDIGNNALFDGIPVRIGQTAYLFDMVSGDLFENRGSGVASFGQDKSVPTFTPKTEIDLLAPLASPAFTGTPTAPTAPSGTNTTQVATTAFVQTAIASAVQDLDLSIVSGKLCVSFEE